ncbi:hypothetical protein AAFP35_17030 [Gordonia sp. CPCC 206044]|uniref:hypothetical protein n=1 Tax=Gordonia sp. CPCC 206044 TaxID=3140793 RepID=UPI003AF3AA16
MQRSRSLSIAVIVAGVAGLLAGLAQFGTRDPVVHDHVEGTSAWPAHLVLTVVAVAWIAAIWWARRTGRAQWLVPLNPIGADARRRWAALRPIRLGTAARGAVAIVLFLVVIYGVWRAAEQITAGLDPNFTSNAWGGPSYLGAMYCHYLDGGLIMAVAAVLLKVVLPSGDRAGERHPTGV